MATQLFFINDYETFLLGAEWDGLDDGTIYYLTGMMRTTRGSTAIETGRSASPTNGTPWGGTTNGRYFVTEPFASAVTIAGAITVNLRCRENAMGDNIGAQLVLYKLAPDGTTTLVLNSERGVEMGTSEAAQNWSPTPTSTAFAKGDRLIVAPMFNNVGTLGVGSVGYFTYSGPTAGASGDSYITLTENLTFRDTLPAGTIIYPTDTASDVTGAVSDTGFVAGGTYENVDNAGKPDWATPTNASASDNAYATCTPAGAGTDYLVCRNLGLSLPAGSIILGIEVELEWKGVLAGTEMVVRIQDESGALIGSQRVNELAVSNVEQTGYIGGSTDTWDVTLTEAMVEHANFGVRVWHAAGITTLLEVDRIRVKVYHSIVAPTRRESWTSRGAGVVDDVRNTVTGPTSGVQITDTAGGTVVDWFTRQLSAVTLTNAIAVNLRGLKSHDLADARLACQIAVVDGDGTNPVIIAYARGHEGELTLTEAAYLFYLGIADAVIAGGQRLRIRVFLDDSTQVMTTGHTGTFYYAGTSGGASGDSYLTFTETLTEFVSRVPRFTLYPQLLAH
jgi:hypothetical protein